MDWNGQVAIVTGASSGIGLEIAKLLSQRGAKLALVARSKVRLESLAKELEDSISIPADLTRIPDIQNIVEQTWEHFGKINLLVNCAGRGYDAPIETTDMEITRFIFELDFIAPLAAMQSVVPIMRNQGKGAIVNVSSGTALMYLENNGAYSSIKRALANLSLTARAELKKDNISVSVAYPYITLTNFEKNTIKSPELAGENETEGDGPPFPPDTPEYVAQRILEGVENGEAEIFLHDWMKNLPRQES